MEKGIKVGDRVRVSEDGQGDIIVSNPTKGTYDYDPEEAAEYAVKVAKSVMEGLKKK